MTRGINIAGRVDKRLAELVSQIREGAVDTLSEDHLPYLFRVLHPLSSRWYVFTLHLYVMGQDQIARNGRAVDECLALGLAEWLKSGEASWSTLIKAVSNQSGGAHFRLAQEIVHMYKELYSFKPIGFCTQVSSEDVGMSCPNSDRLLATIQKLLSSKVASRWFQMGVVMGVPLAALESIRTSPDLTSSVEREMAMLRCWIEQRPLLPRTWQVLVEAVENKAGGNYRVLARDMSRQIPSLIEELRRETARPQAPAIVVNPLELKSEAFPPRPQVSVVNPLDRSPTLKQLTLIRTGQGTGQGGKIEVLKSIAPFWREVGVMLDFDASGAQLALIESQRGQNNPLGCCQAMMMHWLNGNGEQPATWGKLLEILNDSEKLTLARDLEQALRNS